MPSFSGLKAMGLAPKPVESYYEEPIGSSMNTVNYQGSYSNRDFRPYYMDPQREQRRSMEQMPQQYQYDQLQNQLRHLPEIQRLEDIERQERTRSGLERLQALGQKQAFQDKLQQGQIDYWTPEGRRQMSQAVGLGYMTPSSLSAIRAASPKAEALAEAAYNLNTAGSEEELNSVLQRTDKSLHLEPEFRTAFHEARSRINKANADNDNRLINRALESGMDQDEIMKYLNPEMTRVVDKGSFMKAYGDHLRTERAKKQIFTPAWRSEDDKLLNEAITRQTTEPTLSQLEPVLRNLTKDVEREFTKNPASPEEIQRAYQEWKTAPSRMLNARKKMAEDMLNQALGRQPAPDVQQIAQPQDAKAKALNLLKSQGLLK